MTPPKPRDVVEDVVGRELPTYDSLLRERDRLKQVNEKLREGLVLMQEHLCDSRADGHPCSQMWYQDVIEETLAEADELEGSWSSEK